MSREEKGIDEQIRAFHSTLNILRSENGCPWDRRQSISDLASYLIDEAYELQNEVTEGNQDGIAEEIGDTLYVLIYIHYLFFQERNIPLASIISSAHEKIRMRHPHVFSGSRAETVRESISEWEKVKNSGKENASLMDSVPESLSPMRRAISVSRKAVNTGFDWPDQEGIMEKIEEEIEELREATEGGDIDHIREETGDILFTMVNLALHNRVDPEGALSTTVEKFISRFRKMEKMARERGTTLRELDMESMEKLWQETKKSSS
ncbi:MAG: nucleoside triphosphate pyrophosphohydrolase [Candidatus Latescibacteria bacterium]|nr:nucleoside triphosphate pyrophosphohydrolase [bacterium]MBD3423137.1 nucleoside triphosphate pyrophosphohydrolase [Candidatus Latescibacterota bacterium]